MLIVVEGLDGSGKSTQVRKLREYLEKSQKRLEYIHFPRYDAPVYGELIGKFLRGGFGDINSVNPQFVALLFAEDRHLACPQMRKTLEEGGTVLLDRYVYSNIAYQCAKVSDPAERENLRHWIIETEYGDFNLPVPDLNLFLDSPIGFVEEKLSHKRGGKDRQYLEGKEDIHESDINFQKKVRDLYIEQTKEDPDFTLIDCSDGKGAMLPQDSIFAKITQAVEGI